MDRIEKDEARERRIVEGVVVDAYGEEERAPGWYYYLEDRCSFPFTAVCESERAISPLLVGDEVEVVGMAPEDECEREMFVEIRWKPRPLAVLLTQLRFVAAEAETLEAVEDCTTGSRGYQF